MTASCLSVQGQPEVRGPLLTACAAVRWPVSAAGEERRLQRAGTYRQAQAACQRLEADRRRLGDAAFCQHYGLPGRFAD
jgi:hypothetical protein